MASKTIGQKIKSLLAFFISTGNRVGGRRPTDHLTAHCSPWHSDTQVLRPTPTLLHGYSQNVMEHRSRQRLDKAINKRNISLLFVQLEDNVCHFSVNNQHSEWASLFFFVARIGIIVFQCEWGSVIVPPTLRYFWCRINMIISFWDLNCITWKYTEKHYEFVP